MIVGLKVIIYNIHLSGNFKKLIQHKKRSKVMKEWNLSMQCLTVFKSFRLSGVPERIARYVYQYLMEEEVYNRIK